METHILNTKHVVILSVRSNELYKEKIFKRFNIYDFNSIDKIKLLTKSGKLFKRLLHVVSGTSTVQELFISNVSDALKCDDGINGYVVFIIMWYFVLDSSDAVSQLNTLLIKSYFTGRESERNDLSFYDERKHFIAIYNFIINFTSFVDEASNVYSVYVLNAFLYMMIYFTKYIWYYKADSLFSYTNTIELIVEVIKALIANNITHKESITTLMILVKQLVYINTKTPIGINELILKDIATFVLTQDTVNPKSFVIVYYDYIQMETAVHNETDVTKLLPHNFEEMIYCDYNSKGYTNINPLKTINEIFKLDKHNILSTYLLNDNISNYIECTLLNEVVNVNKRTQKKLLDVVASASKGDDEDDGDDAVSARKTKLKKELLRSILIYHEIIKYQLYKIIKKENKDESKLDALISNIIRYIYDYFNEDYKVFTAVDKKHCSSRQSALYKESLQIQLVYVVKFINLVFKICENEI